ncbi:MAG: hypothetical protein NE330_04170 [Lentisphaeraceae bacterium]|nr:hypothetical protein [Lentisphaeraceae bacterium]
MNSRYYNFLRQSLGTDTRDGWVYAQRVFIGLSLTLILFLVQSTQLLDAGGLLFFRYFSYVSFVIITGSVFGIFCSAVTSEKENNTLDLILMTGSSSLSYILGRYSAKLLIIFNLILILLPGTLFGVTLGGIGMYSILHYYAYLIAWTIFLSSFCFWVSVFFSNTQEALIVGAGGLVLFLFLLIPFGAFPFIRISENLAFVAGKEVFFSEIYFFLLTPIYFLYSACKNLQFGAAFPITFYEEFQRKVAKKEKIKLQTYLERVSFRSVRNFWKSPIKEKDELLFPKKKFFKAGDPASIIVGILMILVFPLTIFLTFTLFIPLTLYNIWSRLITCFSYEIENETLESIYLLPLTTEELIKEKLESAGIKSRFLIGMYALTLLSSLIGLFGSLSVGSWRGLSTSLAYTFLPALYFALIYITIISVFKVEKMVRLSSFCLNFLLMIIYFAIPIAGPLLFLIAIPYLKKHCVKLMDECVARS